MKIILLGDTHFGARNNSPAFHNFFEKCYTDVFFKYILDNKITKIIQVGDIFDQRKAINVLTIYEAKKYFFDKLKEYNIELYNILGNHDIYFKSDVIVNSPSLLLKEYDNIKIIDKPREFTFGHCKFLFIPWICEGNKESVQYALETTDAQYLVAHLELAGFEMFKGQVSIHGHEEFNVELLEKFEKVYTGHYHHQSIKKNIHYIGTFYDTTWADYNDQKGFHVIDTSEFPCIEKFIANPLTMHKVIVYDNDIDINDFDYSVYKNCIIKILIENRRDPVVAKKFEKFLGKLEQYDIVDIKIIEQDFKENMSEVVLENIVQAENTIGIISGFIEESTIVSANKTEIKDYIITLYQKVLTNER